MGNAISKIPVEVFANYIVEKLRKVNPFLVFAVIETAFVLGGAVVHIPQAGASPEVVKNRTTFPAQAVQREDSFIDYALNVFTTTPTHITWHEENEISYDKTDSVLNDHVETLIEAIGDDILYCWVTGLKANGTSDVIPAKNIIRTTGADVAVTEEGQVGMRKAFSYKDLAKAQSLMNKMNVPKTDRYALLESYQYEQLIDSLSSNQMAAFQQTADIANGIVGKLAGFNIMERSSVLAFNGNTPIAPGTAFSANTCIGALCWQKDSVAVAKGDIKPFQNTDDPQYYGDIFSAAVKVGGRCRRADWAGVVAIVQGTASGASSSASAASSAAASSAAPAASSAAPASSSAAPEQPA